MNHDPTNQNESDIIRIAIAEDQNLTREGIELILGTQSDMQVAVSAQHGRDLLDQMAEQTVDVVLLDHDMPVLNGKDTLTAIRKDQPQIPVVILTMHQDEYLMVDLIKAGAQGFLIKGENSTILFEAIRTVVRGQKYLPPYATDAIIEALRNQAKAAPTPESSFTVRERDILRIVGSGDRQSMADQLHMEVSTLDWYLTRLRKKTNCTTTNELVKWAIDHGYQD